MVTIPKGKKGFYKAFLSILNEVEKEGRKKRLILHSCCAPCSSSVVETLKPYFDITIYYYNPNIHPPKEYKIRMEENKWFAEKIMKIGFIEADYNPKEWFNLIKGYESELEGGERCKICYRSRLEKTAIYAKKENADYFTTTLSVSPHKNSQWINEIGLELEDKYKIKFLISDFKKNGGYQRSLQLSREHSLYRQTYCGCIYSYKESITKRSSNEK